jgi:hypothetical protein
LDKNIEGMDVDIQSLGAGGEVVGLRAETASLWTGKICVFVWQRIGQF